MHAFFHCEVDRDSGSIKLRLLDFHEFHCAGWLLVSLAVPQLLVWVHPIILLCDTMIRILSHRVSHPFTIQTLHN